MTHILQHALLRYTLQPDEAASRQMREAGLDLAFKSAGRIGAERAKPRGKAELPVLCTNEVEDGQAVFMVMQAEPAAKLLQVDGEAFCRPEEENRIDLRDVDALVVEVDDKNKVDLSAD